MKTSKLKGLIVENAEGVALNLVVPVQREIEEIAEMIGTVETLERPD